MDEADLIPLSALQHFAFCERQFALIHIEQIWQENSLTAEGRVMHDIAHSGEVSNRGDLKTLRTVSVSSEKFGLYGQCDIVELHRTKGTSGCFVPGCEGRWLPMPVEYKRGKPKKDLCDIVQLCAQAFCLEEAFKIEIPEGAIFYGALRQREKIVLSGEIRRQTESYILQLRAMLKSGVTPKAEFNKKCKSCSLLSLCLPSIGSSRRNIQQYLDKSMEEE